MSNLLFYSPFCSLSVHVIQLLKNNDLIKYFKLINVTAPQKPIIPIQITKIPAAVIPRINRILEAQDLLVFIQQLIAPPDPTKTQVYREIETPATNELPERPSKKNILGFVKDEMSGLSNSYTFFNVDIKPQHINPEASKKDHNIFTAQELNKITAEEQKRRLEERKREDNEIHKILENQNIKKAQLMAYQESLDQKIKQTAQEKQKAIISNLIN